MMGFKAASLSSSFAGISILGFIISAVYLPSRSPSWALAFCLLFIFMFISSIISMTHADADSEDTLRELHIRPRHK